VHFFIDSHYWREELGELMPAVVAADQSRCVKQVAPVDNPLEMISAVHSVLGRYIVLVEVECAVGTGAIPFSRANPDCFAFARDLFSIYSQASARVSFCYFTWA